MKKLNAKKKTKNDAANTPSEMDIPELSIKKLTLKTGVKGGLAGTCATSCCACTCHTAQQ
jgi:hypothetical protein